MANQQGLVHPGLLARLQQTGHFPATCTIQAPAETQDSYGAVVQTWANVSGLVDLPCRLAPEIQRSGEFNPQGQTWGRQTFRLVLAGHYPTITAKMRVVMDDESIYNITMVQLDGQGVTTRLFVEVVA